MSVFAAVDIGSNSVRLKIARVVHHRLQEIHEDRVVTRLGESVFRFGVLSPEAMDATVNVLRRFHRAVRKYAADRVRVVATSALRDARNAAAFVAWVRSATGWKVETVSGLEEGRLIHLGLLTHSNLAASKMLLLDLGDGSCEMTISERGHIRNMVSLPLGAVRLTEQFLPHDPPPAHRSATAARGHRRGDRCCPPAHCGGAGETDGCHLGDGRSPSRRGARHRSPQSRSEGRAGFSRRGGALGGPARTVGCQSAGQTARDRTAPCGDRRRGRLRFCRTDGAMRLAEIPLFAPGAARRDSGSNAG